MSEAYKNKMSIRKERELKREEAKKLKDDFLKQNPELDRRKDRLKI